MRRLSAAILDRFLLFVFRDPPLGLSSKNQLGLPSLERKYGVFIDGSIVESFTGQANRRMRRIDYVAGEYGIIVLESDASLAELNHAHKQDAMPSTVNDQVEVTINNALGTKVDSSVLLSNTAERFPPACVRVVKKICGGT